MRTRWIYTDADGVTRASGVTDLNLTPIPDSLEMELAGDNLISLTKKYKDGTSREWFAIEYGCQICGSYDHKDGTCTCEHCGNFWTEHTDHGESRQCGWADLAPDADYG